MKIKNIFVIVFLFLLTALILNLANPLFDKPSRDGGFFLYAGQQILNGKIPYQDFWDSKGPGIFYINALGLLLGNGSRWGVWIVEFIFIYLTFWALYQGLSKRWNLINVLFGITLAGVGLKTVLGYGNYTEEYALLFNTIGILLFLSSTQHEKKYWKYFGTGALFGLSFMFRANNIGGLFAILIALSIFYTFKKNIKEMLKHVLLIIIGLALPLVLWILYFALLHLADDMIYASILFNFSYATAEERNLLALFSGLGRYGMGWVAWITVLAWLIFTWKNFSKQHNWHTASLVNIFLLFWFPVEVLLSNLSGRDFSHYYISWVIAVAIYNVMFFDDIQNFLIQRFSLRDIEKWGLLAITIVLIISLIPTLPRYAQSLSLISKPNQPREFVYPLAEYVRENTQPTDLVLTWYPDLGINFTAERESPVKHVYYPLFLGESLTTDIENQYIADLTSQHPTLIVDCSREIDAIPSLDVTTRKEQFATPGLRSKMYIPPSMAVLNDFVKTNYFIETKTDGCIIFRANSK